MKPILSYYGGKQRIASRIVDVLHTIPHKVYVEPFAGGAAVLFAKGKPRIPWRSQLPHALAWRERILTELSGTLPGQYKMAI
jgi:hypothetical protein